MTHEGTARATLAQTALDMEELAAALSRATAVVSAAEENNAQEGTDSTARAVLDARTARDLAQIKLDGAARRHEHARAELARVERETAQALLSERLPLTARRPLIEALAPTIWRMAALDAIPRVDVYAPADDATLEQAYLAQAHRDVERAKGLRHIRNTIAAQHANVLACEGAAAVLGHKLADVARVPEVHVLQAIKLEVHALAATEIDRGWWVEWLAPFVGATANGHQAMELQSAAFRAAQRRLPALLAFGRELCIHGDTGLALHDLVDRHMTAIDRGNRAIRQSAADDWTAKVGEMFAALQLDARLRGPTVDPISQYLHKTATTGPAPSGLNPVPGHDATGHKLPEEQPPPYRGL